MTACNLQIVNAYEKLGMTVEEIAAHQELEPLSVKAVLMQFSPLFQQHANSSSVASQSKAVAVVGSNNTVVIQPTNGEQDDEVCFTAEEHVLAHDVIVNTARYAEDERLAFKAACYIRDDKKGRLDVIKNVSGLSINVLQFNETLQKAIEAKKRARSAINIESECKAA